MLQRAEENRTPDGRRSLEFDTRRCETRAMGSSGRDRLNAGAACSLKRHVVFCPKFRRPVPVDLRDTCGKPISGNVAGEQGMTRQTMAVMADHVHRFVAADLTLQVAGILHRRKGAPNRILRCEFPHLRHRPPTLRNRRYDASSAGTVSDAVRRRSIEAQQGV